MIFSWKQSRKRCNCLRNCLTSVENYIFGDPFLLIINFYCQFTWTFSSSLAVWVLPWYAGGWRDRLTDSSQLPVQPLYNWMCKVSPMLDLFYRFSGFEKKNLPWSRLTEIIKLRNKMVDLQVSVESMKTGNSQHEISYFHVSYLSYLRTATKQQLKKGA